MICVFNLFFCSYSTFVLCFPLGPALCHSFCPLYPPNLTLHLFFLFLSFYVLFPPPLPSVTIATEERPFIEKGICLAGPPSHLAGRGGWGGRRSSGSMFESNPPSSLRFHHSLCHLWPLTPSASPSAPTRWSCEAAWECCATDLWPAYWAAHDTIQCCVTVWQYCTCRPSFLLGDSVITYSMLDVFLNRQTNMKTKTNYFLNLEVFIQQCSRTILHELCTIKYISSYTQWPLYWVHV